MGSGRGAAVTVAWFFLSRSDPIVHLPLVFLALPPPHSCTQLIPRPSKSLLVYSPRPFLSKLVEPLKRNKRSQRPASVRECVDAFSPDLSALLCVRVAAQERKAAPRKVERS